MQNFAKAHTFARLSLLSITVTGILTSAHHLYRFGLSVLILAIIVIFLPYVLLRWFQHMRSKAAFCTYGLFNVLVIGWFGFVDGGLDHALKAVNQYVLAPFFGGVPPLGMIDFRLLPPTTLVGDFVYESTGVLSFIASVFAGYYVYKFMREGHRTQIQGTRS